MGTKASRATTQVRLPKALAEAPEQRLVELVATFGPHPCSQLGLDLDPNSDPGGTGVLERWLVASCVLGVRATESLAIAAVRQLEADGLGIPAAILEHGPAHVGSSFEYAGLEGTDSLAVLLWRVSRSLEDHYGGSLERLAADCDDLEGLAQRIAGLGPGMGRSGVARFLRPLRELWAAASDLPLDPAAHAAAIHLQLIGDMDDAEGAPGTLRSLLQGDGAPALRDAEAALARIGAVGCRRARPERCLLRELCPVRNPGEGPSVE